MTQDIYLWGHTVLQLVIGVGLGYYITVLKRAIDAQEKTISAQSKTLEGMKSLNEAMKTVLESMNEPNTLDRLKASKAFIEEERQLMLQQFERLKAELPEKITERTINFLAPQFMSVIAGLFDFASKVIPFIPPAQRRAALNSVDIPPFYTLQLKEDLLRIADPAPDLTGVEPPRWGTIGELLAWGVQAKSDRSAGGDQNH